MTQAMDITVIKTVRIIFGWIMPATGIIVNEDFHNYFRMDYASIWPDGYECQNLSSCHLDRWYATRKLVDEMLLEEQYYLGTINFLLSS